MAFHAMFADHLEYSSTHDSAVDLVANVHYGDPYPLVGVRGVTFLGYSNYLDFMSFYEFSLDIPELIVEYKKPGEIYVIE